MIYTYIITSILTKRGSIFPNARISKTVWDPLNKKPRATVHGAGLYFLRGVRLLFFKLDYVSFKTLVQIFLLSLFLFCSALYSWYMNHAPLIIIPPIKIFSSMFCLVFDCRLSVRVSVARSSF